MPTVLCIEDQPAVVEHARHFLEQVTPRLRCVTAGSGREGLALARAHTPEVVLLDLALPDGDGLELIEPLRNAARAPAIVVYTGNREDATLRRLEGLGIAGLLWKGGVAGADLVRAVEGILAGETYLSPKLEDFFDAARLRAPQPVARPAAVRERIVVVKAERLRAETIARAAREACPDADVTVCHTAAVAAASLRAEPAALGLFGLTLPDQDGLDLLAVAECERWCRRVMIVTGRRDERTLHGLRRAQIDGCFDIATEPPEGLVGAIRKVVAGGAFFSAGVLIAEKFPAGAPPTLGQLLTETELLVFAVIGDGSDDRQAAARLVLSETTVHNHRQHLMRKLSVQTRTELMREAIRRGVVRYTDTGGVLTPGLEQPLAVRAARLRNAFGADGRGEGEGES
jgi:DNA-binding NarL/FixJ family response regulator